MWVRYRDNLPRKSRDRMDWKNTYIQKENIHDDFGLYNSPDEFYSEKGTNLSGVKRWLYQSVIRHLINMNVNRLKNASNQSRGKNAQPQS